MHALRQEILPPNGVEFAASLKLTPSTIADDTVPTPSTSAVQDNITSRALYNLVVARSNILRVFEVKEEPAPISAQLDDERERRSNVRRGTEAVEGEVEMDEQGEGFVNVGSLKVISNTSCHLTAEHTIPAVDPVLSWSRTLKRMRIVADRLILVFSLPDLRVPPARRLSFDSTFFESTVFTEL